MPDHDAAMRSHTELDAVISAHRQMLVLMFMALARDPEKREALFAAIEQRLAFHDGHEDPGAEADTAVAFEVRVDQEFRRMVADVRSAVAVQSAAEARD